MLGDAAGLARRDVGRTQRVEQRGLAVVHMAHDGDHRRARHQLGLGIDGALQAHLHVGFRNAARAVAEFLHHQFGGVGIQRLRDGRHDAEFHQRLDHLAGARGHAVGEFLHRDGVRKNDVAHDLHLIGAQPLQFCLTAFAFALAPHRGQRADAFVLALDRRLHVDTTGAAARVGALLGHDGLRLARHHDAARAADRPRLVLLLHRLCRGGGAESRSASPAWRPARERPGTPGLVGATRHRGRGLNVCRGLGRLAGCLLGFLSRRVQDRLAGFLFRGLALLFFPPARLLGGREDGDRLLLAPFRLALRRLALLLDQRALPRRLLGGRQGARDSGDRRPLARCGAGARGRRRRTRRWNATRRRTRRSDRGALLAHLDLHHLGTSVAEALSHRPGVDRAAELQTARGPQREPALRSILIVGFAHRLPVGPVRLCLFVCAGLAAAAVSPQSP